MASENTQNGVSSAPDLISLPAGFHINPVDFNGTTNAPQTSPPSFLDDLPDTPALGPLSAFKGTFVGQGLNTIWRPDNDTSPTTFPNPLHPTQKPPYPLVLELNLVTETLTFAQELGSVPNRGFRKQGDIFLNGIPYTQAINAVTNEETGKGDGPEIGIHYEPGLWMHVPASTSPKVPATLNRMASIPHGTTINAQGRLGKTNFGAPDFSKHFTSIFPFFINGGHRPTSDTDTNPGLESILRATLDVDRKDMPRLPQDLSKFKIAGTIDSDILKDISQVLERANKGKKILEHTVFTVSTNPREDKALDSDEFESNATAAETYGGGAANIAFLSGANTGGEENANAKTMISTFWVNKVEHTLTVPAHPGRPNGGPITIASKPPNEGLLTAKFLFHPPRPLTKAVKITVTSTEIQYLQNVDLNFDAITWPHVSVSTLVPRDPVSIPDSAFDKAVPV